MKPIRFSNVALADMEAAHAYLAERNPAAASRLLELLIDSAQRLGRSPELGRARPEYGGVHSLLAGKYLIFYRIDSDAISVLRVLHGARDLDALLDDAF